MHRQDRHESEAGAEQKKGSSPPDRRGEERCRRRDDDHTHSKTRACDPCRQTTSLLEPLKRRRTANDERETHAGP